MEPFNGIKNNDEQTKIFIITAESLFSKDLLYFFDL